MTRLPEDDLTPEPDPASAAEVAVGVGRARLGSPWGAVSVSLARDGLDHAESEDRGDVQLRTGGRVFRYRADPPARPRPSSWCKYIQAMPQRFRTRSGARPVRGAVGNTGVPVRNLIGASVAVAPRWVQSSTDRRASSRRRCEGPQGEPAADATVVPHGWRAAAGLRSERRVGRGRGDQAARW